MNRPITVDLAGFRDHTTGFGTWDDVRKNTLYCSSGTYRVLDLGADCGDLELRLEFKHPRGQGPEISAAGKVYQFKIGDTAHPRLAITSFQRTAAATGMAALASHAWLSPSISTMICSPPHDAREHRFAHGKLLPQSYPARLFHPDRFR